jgi:hypothetical protein
MHVLLSILLFSFLSLAAFSQQRQPENDYPEVQEQEEEVQLIEEEEFEPFDEQGNPEERQLELDPEDSERYLEDVDISH